MMLFPRRSVLAVFALGLAMPFCMAKSNAHSDSTSQVQTATKVKDILIYQDDQYYSSFPSVIRKPDGEFLLAFRRAPERKIFGEKSSNHVDPNSYLVALRSKDGENWTKEPEVI